MAPKIAGVFHGKDHLEMDDDWGYPYDLGNSYIYNNGTCMMTI